MVRHFCLVLLALHLAACPRDASGPPPSPVPPDTSRTPTTAPARDTVATTRPASEQWPGCDGDLSIDDVPQTPLRASVGGHALRPTVQVVRGSVLGREIRFDFADPVKWDTRRPCFVGPVRAAVGFRRASADYAEGLDLAPGEYQLGSGWRAHHSLAVNEEVKSSHPAFYGLLVLDKIGGLARRPDPMFTPTGRAQGRVALCFEDGSWLAGSFTAPVCGDAPR